jgi:uncharacterized membrane protein
MGTETVLLLAFAIGIVAGLRAFTGPAVTAWASHMRGFALQPTHLGFMGSTITAVIFALLAAFEIVNDKLPKTPARTALPSVVVRMITGALAGATLSVAGSGSATIGAVCGAVGSLVGTFGGYYARTGLVRALKVPDFVIALVEDVIAVGGAILIATRI